MSEEKLTAEQIQSQIKAAGYDWEVGETPISQLSREEQELRLGLDVDEDDVARIERALEAAALRAVRQFEYSSERDWRNKDGNNWVTPVRNQGACGSCVAFGTVATIECQARIQHGDISWSPNLSEADLFFCGAGKKCQAGWWPIYALNYAKDQGIPDEDCFPYQDHDMDCKPCSDRADRILKVGNWNEIIDISQRKEWLDQRGPLVACMAVYSDFFSYKSGVYRHVTGDLAGYHCISCIGYSEKEGCWICKNSWGTSWGDQGFFKIAYGQAGIDTQFAMYGVEKISGTPPEKEEKKWYYNKKVLSTFAHYTSQWAWANIEGLGWRQIQSGAPDGVTNMFFAFCEALANNRRVHVYADDKLIYTMYLI
jgi:C1A family cysteine protease